MPDIHAEPPELPPQTCRGPCDHLPPGQFGIMIIVGPYAPPPWQ